MYLDYYKLQTTHTWNSVPSGVITHFHDVFQLIVPIIGVNATLVKLDMSHGLFRIYNL